MRLNTSVSLAVAAALVTLATPASGQKTFSLRAGANFATFGGADAGSPGHRTALNVGAAMTFDVSPNVGVQVGALYSQRGATDEESGVSAKMSMDYFEVPVLLKLGIPSQGNASAHVYLGPAVAFKVKCDAEVGVGGAKISASCSEGDIPIKSVDFGAVGGVGMDMKTSSSVVLSLDVFYNLGLVNFPDSGGGSLKHRVFTAQAGVGFPIG